MVKIYLDVAHPKGPLYPRNPLIKLLIYMWGSKVTNVGLTEQKKSNVSFMTEMSSFSCKNIIYSKKCLY